MHLSIALASLLLAAAPSFGSPIRPEEIFSRQSSAKGCGTNIYTVEAQANAFEFASDTLDRIGRTFTGTEGSAFPHEFKNIEKLELPDCPGVPGPFREFPIMPGGKVLFTPSNRPGTDRIIYKITATDPNTHLPQNFVFCGVVTHTGAPQPNGFVSCGG